MRPLIALIRLIDLAFVEELFEPGENGNPDHTLGVDMLMHELTRSIIGALSDYPERQRIGRKALAEMRAGGFSRYLNHVVTRKESSE